MDGVAGSVHLVRLFVGLGLQDKDGFSIQLLCCLRGGLGLPVCGGLRLLVHDEVRLAGLWVQSEAYGKQGFAVSHNPDIYDIKYIYLDFIICGVIALHFTRTNLISS